MTKEYILAVSCRVVKYTKQYTSKGNQESRELSSVVTNKTENTEREVAGCVILWKH